MVHYLLAEILIASQAFCTNAQANGLALVFHDASDCLTRCSLSLDRSGHQVTGLPHEFRDLIKSSAWRTKFVALVAGLPPEFAGIGEVQSGEDYPHDMPPGGTLKATIRAQGHLLYIYDDAGLTSGPNDAPRRPIGDFYVIVEAKTKEMAGIWNGPEDENRYEFSGPDSLLAPLLAYVTAREAELEKAYLISDLQHSNDLIIPAPTDRLASYKSRLNYLATKLVEDSRIEGARSSDAAGDERRHKDERTWFAISTNKSCMKSNSPASKIEEIRDNGLRESTEDTNDAQGNLMSVAVSYTADLTTVTTTYYTSRAGCEAALAQKLAVPGKYE